MPRFDAVEFAARPARSTVAFVHRGARRTVARAVTRALIVAVLAGTVVGTLAACGQRGPLFLPDKDNPDKRR